MELNPPKPRLPGKGESQPAVGEGGRPFEPGRVRDDSVLRARWESANQFCCVRPGGQGDQVCPVLSGKATTAIPSSWHMSRRCGSAEAS